MLSSKRIKAISIPKNSEGGKKKREKSPEEIAALQILKELRHKRKMVAQGCRDRQLVLEAEFRDFYNLYPKYKPKKREKPSKSEEVFSCTDSRFANCKAIIFNYPNKDRKTITWEKVPRYKKSKGVSDGGCRCGW